MFMLVSWADDESMPEETPLTSTTVDDAKREAETLFPNAYQFILLAPNGDVHNWTDAGWYASIGNKRKRR